MQINSDISPIISPKSNLSTSFISPRDVIFMNLNSNSNRNVPHIHNNNHINNNQNIKSSHTGSHKMEFEFSNHITTNESYSIEIMPLGKAFFFLYLKSHIFSCNI